MIDITKVQNACIKLFPKSLVKQFLPFFGECFEYGGITNKERAAMFIGQVGIECGGFTTFSENLNYSANGLVKTFRNKFRLPRTEAETAMEIFSDKKRNPFFYDYDPFKLANYVYANKGGNRNEASKDGWRFRGRGPKQITLAGNYVAGQNALRKIEEFRDLDLVNDPDQLLIPRMGLYAAGWYWKSNGISRHADSGNIELATKAINSAGLHMKERGELFHRALVLLS